jgi:hypothetical protein
MTPEQAIQILSQVALVHVGTRKDHEVIEAALKVISELAQNKYSNVASNEP